MSPVTEVAWQMMRLFSPEKHCYLSNFPCIKILRPGLTLAISALHCQRFTCSVMLSYLVHLLCSQVFFQHPEATLEGTSTKKKRQNISLCFCGSDTWFGLEITVHRIVCLMGAASGKLIDQSRGMIFL